MRKKWLWRTLAVLAGLVVVTVLVFTVSPWPSALIIRQVFQDGAKKTAAIMAPYAPTSGVDSVLDVQYATDSAQPHVKASDFTQLDVFYPTGTTTQLGTVIWTHGGAWISGNKSNDRSYFEILASKGYTVVGLNYTYGPEATYPTAVFELNQAHQFLLENAEKFHIDPSKIVLAGDSAGAQLSSQLAALITNPEFAKEMDFTPALSPEQLQGVVLNCGVYQLTSLIGAKGILGWGDDVSLWAYTGDRDITTSPAMAQMSTINHVNGNFPATYISGGNADPLTAENSKPFAAKLQSLGVNVTELFWPADYTPPLPHEYQFKLNLDAAQTALNETLSFLNERIGSASQQ
ncbi:acetyl esterase [Aurantimicrobium minutum]|uniref:alpha/beta hydrolase n=1 Tax=Aurantimicrobium minutum TaxID=708131 RepID=UPI002473FEAF|nr:alpha/beta hydrolase [Aurantimicrobium minutum]MDH6425119.1 acetyl esterase [Aurantimicrobium minutum]